MSEQSEGIEVLPQTLRHSRSTGESITAQRRTNRYRIHFGHQSNPSLMIAGNYFGKRSHRWQLARVPEADYFSALSSANNSGNVNRSIIQFASGNSWMMTQV